MAAKRELPIFWEGLGGVSINRGPTIDPNLLRILDVRTPRRDAEILEASSPKPYTAPYLPMYPYIPPSTHQKLLGMSFQGHRSLKVQRVIVGYESNLSVYPRLLSTDSKELKVTGAMSEEIPVSNQSMWCSVQV